MIASLSLPYSLFNQMSHIITYPLNLFFAPCCCRRCFSTHTWFWFHIVWSIDWDLNIMFCLFSRIFLFIISIHFSIYKKNYRFCLILFFDNFYDFVIIIFQFIYTFLPIVIKLQHRMNAAQMPVACLWHILIITINYIQIIFPKIATIDRLLNTLYSSLLTLTDSITKNTKNTTNHINKLTTLYLVRAICSLLWNWSNT